MSTEALGIDFVIVSRVRVLLAGYVIDVDVDIFNEVCVIAVLPAVIALEVIMAV